MTKICSLKHANEQCYCTVAIKLYIPMDVTYRNIYRMSRNDTNGNQEISLDIQICILFSKKSLDDSDFDLVLSII